jgi:hypothetical protein
MRKWARLLVAGFIVTLLGLYPLLAPPIHRIDKDHAELIKQGMTYAEVESVFGQPPGNYDWAVADEANIWVWDVATGAKLRGLNSYSTLVIDGFSSDSSLWGEAATITLPSRTKTRTYTTWLLGARFGVNAKSWTSRHGTCTIFFDEELRVTGSMTDWGHTRVEPPWLKWRQKWFGKE